MGFLFPVWLLQFFYLPLGVDLVFSSVERRDAFKPLWILFFFFNSRSNYHCFYFFWLLFAGDKNSSIVDFMWNKYVTTREDLSNYITRDQYQDTLLPPGLYWSNWIIFSLHKEKLCQRALARTKTFLRFPPAAPARMGVTEPKAGRARGRGREQGVLATWRKR